MKLLDQTNILIELTKLKDIEGINTTKFINEILDDGKINYDAVILINRHTHLPQFKVFNDIYENRQRKKTYRDIVKDRASVDDKATALSSFVTQSLIAVKYLEDYDKHEFLNMTQVNVALHAVTEYVNNGDDELIIDTCKEFAGLFDQLYRKEIQLD